MGIRLATVTPTHALPNSGAGVVIARRRRVACEKAARRLVRHALARKLLSPWELLSAQDFANAVGVRSEHDRNVLVLGPLQAQDPHSNGGLEIKRASFDQDRIEFDTRNRVRECSHGNLLSWLQVAPSLTGLMALPEAGECESPASTLYCGPIGLVHKEKLSTYYVVAGLSFWICVAICASFLRRANGFDQFAAHAESLNTGTGHFPKASIGSFRLGASSSHPRQQPPSSSAGKGGRSSSSLIARLPHSSGDESAAASVTRFPGGRIAPCPNLAGVMAPRPFP